jgi:L-cystine uptake protein TcyP (sodium:dicarboxylate symporter family)
MNPSLILNLALALAVCALLYVMQQRHVSFTKRVFTALGLGVLLGAGFQAVYGNGATVIKDTNAYLDIIGSGYVKLLQMIIMPLIMVSIIQAILKLRNASSLGKISALTIGTLMATTAVAASIGILMAKLFGLTAVGLTSSAAEAGARRLSSKGKLSTAQDLSLPKMILSFIPENPFLDMTGARNTSTIAVVLFSIFIGVSATGIAGKKPEVFESFSHFIHVAHVIVMRMVTLVLRLTPVRRVRPDHPGAGQIQPAGHPAPDRFVMASYSALILMFGVHLLLITLAGLNPLRYVKKIFPVLTFAFTSRTVGRFDPDERADPDRPPRHAGRHRQLRRQLRRDDRPERLRRHLSGDAGGDDRPDRGHRSLHQPLPAPLIGVITIGSVGVAGVGGGATFAALIVLSAMNLPVALAGLLISIEPLIDMGRTALNVSGSITAGTITSRVLGQTDMKIFNSDAELNLDSEEQVA